VAVLRPSVTADSSIHSRRIRNSHNLLILPPEEFSSIPKERGRLHKDAGAFAAAKIVLGSFAAGRRGD